MIIGIGIDYVDIRRIQRLLEEFPRFMHRIFTPQERTYAQQRTNPAGIYAKRFAAKEAFIKATGKKLSPSFSWQDVYVENTENGMPFLNFSTQGRHFLMEQFGDVVCHLSLTDEPPYAAAFVVMERILHNGLF